MQTLKYLSQVIVSATPTPVPNLGQVHGGSVYIMKYNKNFIYLLIYL